MRRAARILVVLALAAALAACAASPSPSASATRESTATPTPTPTPTPDPVDALTLEQRVGQVFMVGSAVEGASPEALSAVADRHVGSIFLHGRSYDGAQAIAGLVSQFTSLVATGTTGGVRLWVATDQEGGEVQVLRGPGFEDMPYPIDQAALPDADLRAKALQWGGELRAAGIDMNLAPVADIVTSPDVQWANPPIGAIGRHYGYDAPTVAAKARAFADGMRDAGVLPTFKHFPGLGRVSENTDYARVTDDVVVPGAPDIEVYRALTAAGTSTVMVSNAVYAGIDPAVPAVFSPTVLSVLRNDIGFDGVAITDDVSAADAVEAWAPADRAILALSAGIDVVLVSADPAVLPEMYDAVLARAQTDPAFAARIDEAAGRVLEAKAALPAS